MIGLYWWFLLTCIECQCDWLEACKVFFNRLFVLVSKSYMQVYHTHIYSVYVDGCVHDKRNIEVMRQYALSWLHWCQNLSRTLSRIYIGYILDTYWIHTGYIHGLSLFHAVCNKRLLLLRCVCREGYGKIKMNFTAVSDVDGISLLFPFTRSLLIVLPCWNPFHPRWNHLLHVVVNVKTNRLTSTLHTRQSLKSQCFFSLVKMKSLIDLVTALLPHRYFSMEVWKTEPISPSGDKYFMLVGGR